MTEQVTRTLADYPVGSRWRDGFGRVFTISLIDDTDWPIEGYCHDPQEGRRFGCWTVEQAATWTCIDEPAPDAVPEEVASHMAQRFLSWKLPDNFMPDGGVTFDRGDREPGTAWWPTGTNLFTYNQARAMVQHMMEYLPVRQPAPATDALREAGK